jgi:hypothetical protein
MSGNTNVAAGRPAVALAKLQSVDLAAIRARVEAPVALAPRLDACTTVLEALELLEGEGLLSESVRLLAHAMPRREGVWWVCMCARHTAPPELPPADLAALEAAELWVRRPSDENRRAAFQRAEEARFGTPEAWACVAAFWSGESMSPLGQPAVPPAPHLGGMAIAGAVALAAVRQMPDHQAARLASFIASARDIAGGGSGRLPAEQV